MIADPLPSPTPVPPPKPGEVAAAAVNACETEQTNLIAAYTKAGTEAEIRDLNEKLQSALPSCPEAVATEARSKLLASTTRVERPVKVEEYSQLTVRVARVEGQGANAPAKVEFGPYTFSTPRPAGQWLMYYAANYIFDDDEAFFAKANQGTTPQSYTITEKSDAGGGTFAASLYFMWFSPNQGTGLHCLVQCNWDDGRFMGLTAGLGFDFDNPTVFVGYGFGWGFNAMITGGVAMSKVGRLDGQYRKGDVVLTPLTEDQLREETYEPALYVGLAFRFGANPFKTSKAAAPAPTDEPKKETNAGGGAGDTPAPGESTGAAPTTEPERTQGSATPH